MKTRTEELYEKFQNTKQENIRLYCALEGMFLDCEIPEEAEKSYTQYLKYRIRPAMEFLIQEEDIRKMELLESYGWFGRRELDQFIRTAREKRKMESMVWLMMLKDKKYGYEDVGKTDF